MNKKINQLQKMFEENGLYFDAEGNGKEDLHIVLELLPELKQGISIFTDGEGFEMEIGTDGTDRWGFVEYKITYVSRVKTPKAVMNYIARHTNDFKYIAVTSRI